MRTPKITLMVAALALVPWTAFAQQTPTTPAKKDSVTMTTGWIDFGVRKTDLSGDGARYERYRDLSDGLFLDELFVQHEQNNWVMTASGQHVGARDQRLTGTLVRPGRLKVWGQWDQIPMLLSRTSQSLFVQVAPGELRIPDLIQSTVQTTASQIASMVAQFDRPIELGTMRHIGEGGVQFMPNRALTLNLSYRDINRTGTIPSGGSFGHSSFVETPQPVQHNTQTVDAGAEYVKGDALFRIGYNASLFHNALSSVIFDNPFRLTDTTSAPSAGRYSLAPSSSFFDINGMVTYKLPRHTRVMGYFSLGTLKDAGAAILPQTINPLNTPLALERTTVDGQARTTSANFSFVSRPYDWVNVNVRYKFFDYDNRTPVFDLTQRFAYDNAPSALNPAVETEPFGIKRHTLDVDVALTPKQVGDASIDVGFSQIREDRSLRIISATTENIGRFMFDAVNNHWFTLRAKFEMSHKRGELDEEVFDEMTGLPGCSPTNLTPCSEQAGMRHFDIADRNRNRVTILGSFMPTSTTAIRLSAATGRDNYLNTTFGLLDNTNRVYSAAFDATPTEHLTFSASYAFERYVALSRSRQANKTAQANPQFFDVTRNWSTNGADRVHSVILAADVVKLCHDKLDMRFSYDFNRARSLYTYGTGPIEDRTLPEETDVIASTLPPPTQLPLVRSETLRGTFDLNYALTSKLSLGFTYWYDQYRVSDFTLDQQANPTLTKGTSALLLGYLYMPYTANTYWGRIVYRW